MKVIEFFTLFVGLAFVILPGVKKTLVHYGLFMVIVAGLLICLAFVGLCGAVRECYLKLFVVSKTHKKKFFDILGGFSS